MNVESFVLPIERPFVDVLKNWSEPALTAILLFFAIALVWLAMQKDNALLKAIVLTYIILP